MGDSTGVDGFEPDAEELQLFDEYIPRRPRRRWASRGFGLALLFIASVSSVVGLGDSIHSYARDLGVYDAYRAAPSCTAFDAADGNATSGYCHVSDGVVNAVLSPDPPIYSLGVGPPSTTQVTPGVALVTFDPTPQQAFFEHDEPALAGLQLDDPVDYVTLSGGNVVSLTVRGVTYETLDSPQPQQFWDAATIVMSSAFTLLFGFWFALRVAGRRLTTAWSAPLVAAVAAFAADLAIAGPTSGDLAPPSIGSLVLRIVLISLGATLAISVLRIVPARRRISAAQSSAADMSSA